MPPVLPQVNCDAVGPAQFGKRRSRHRFRLIRLPSLPQSRNVIDIDTQFNHDVATIRSPLTVN